MYYVETLKILDYISNNNGNLNTVTYNANANINVQSLMSNSNINTIVSFLSNTVIYTDYTRNFENDKSNMNPYSISNIGNITIFTTTPDDLPIIPIINVPVDTYITLPNNGYSNGIQSQMKLTSSFYVAFKLKIIKR
jgi:hypothetical protein